MSRDHGRAVSAEDPEGAVHRNDPLRSTHQTTMRMTDDDRGVPAEESDAMELPDYRDERHPQVDPRMERLESDRLVAVHDAEGWVYSQAHWRDALTAAADREAQLQDAAAAEVTRLNDEIARLRGEYEAWRVQAVAHSQAAEQLRYVVDRMDAEAKEAADMAESGFMDDDQLAKRSARGAQRLGRR